MLLYVFYRQEFMYSIYGVLIPLRDLATVFGKGKLIHSLLLNFSHPFIIIYTVLPGGLLDENTHLKRKIGRLRSIFVNLALQPLRLFLLNVDGKVGCLLVIFSSLKSDTLHPLELQKGTHQKGRRRKALVRGGKARLS